METVNVECPLCHAKGTSYKEMAGKPVKCPKCNMTSILKIINNEKKHDQSELVKDDTEQLSNLNTTTKSCPFCAEQILFEAQFCKHCKSSLNEINNNNIKNNIFEKEKIESNFLNQQTKYVTNTANNSSTLSINKLPDYHKLAITLIFWTGHVLAILGWVFAIIIWVTIDRIFVSEELNMGVGITLYRTLNCIGFFSCISGHVLQIFFFWASELLKAVRDK